ncbi:MAG: PEGA domain-containing protein [Myxococcaceae bacterium]|nr:PEGA domain-containing protein [Myxococcaceae bacterium]
MFPAIVVALLLAEPAVASPSLTVVSPTDDALATRAAQTPDLPVALTVSAPPVARPGPAPVVSDVLARARSAWVSADFVTCLGLLNDDARVMEALQRGERTTASRTLAWRVACKVGARQGDGAKRDAEWLATLQLPVPDDLGVMTPDVEVLLTSARRAVDAQPRLPLVIRSPSRDAVVAIDGRPAACIVPCRMELNAGVHLVQVSADGNSPVARPVTVSGDLTELDLVLPPADPALAATQWHERRAQGASLDEGRSVLLLGIALRTPRLLVLGPSEEAGLVRGALAVDGVVQARAERDDVQALVRDLLVRGRLMEPSVPLWKRWPFWLAVGAAVVASGVTTAVLIANRPVITRVELNP